MASKINGLVVDKWALFDEVFNSNVVSEASTILACPPLLGEFHISPYLSTHIHINVIVCFLFQHITRCVDICWVYIMVSAAERFPFSDNSF